MPMTEEMIIQSQLSAINTNFLLYFGDITYKIVCAYKSARMVRA